MKRAEKKSEMSTDPRSGTLSWIMRTPVVSIGMDASLKDALDLCTDQGIRHLPVVDEEGAFVGVLTDRDIRYHISPRLGTISENSSDRATLNRRVHTVMVRNALTGSPDMSIGTAAKIFLHNHIGCLPVLDGDRRLVGMVTKGDFLALLAAAD